VAALFLLLATDALAQPTFINKIPIPPLVDAANGPVNLVMSVTAHKFNPGNPSDSLNGGTGQPNGIRTYAYNVAGSSTMTLLGPTIKWHTHGPTVMTVKNEIGVSTTTHWHGAEVPSSMDGGPHQGILPGATWPVGFQTLDSASTLWYHPHFHDLTVEHVQKGLSGMIIVERSGDQIANTLPRTYGVDDIPVILGDLGFTPASNSSAGMVIDTIKGKRPINLVNGVTNPYVEVPAHMVRLRILNGSTRKGIYFGISDSYNAPFSSLKQFYLVATDGGYTMKPDTLTRILNGPGERDEIVIDLSGYQPGDVVYLSNLKDSLPNSVIGSPLPAPNGGGGDTTIGNAFLELRIVPDNAFPGYVPVTTFTPFTHTWSPGLADTSNVKRHRLKQLVMMTHGGEHAFTIDGTTYDMNVINDTVCVDTKEIWAIKNTTAVAHPFHIHKIQFRVLDVVDSNGNNVDLVANGLNGPKDDVLIHPGWTLRFMGQFDDYPSAIDPMNTYMYHCHILTHEDSIGGGMMHQFVVTNCIGSSSAPEAGSESPAMTLVPNPEEGMLHLKGQSTKPSTLTIFDIQGRHVRGEQIPAFNGNATINIGDLPSGFYLVEWITENGVTTGRMIVSK
jgi:bilirubin oxidase